MCSVIDLIEGMARLRDEQVSHPKSLRSHDIITIVMARSVIDRIGINDAGRPGIRTSVIAYAVTGIIREGGRVDR